MTNPSFDDFETISIGTHEIASISDGTHTFWESEESTVTYNVPVSVTDGTNPVGSATVKLFGSAEEPIATGTTGSAGGCTLSNVPANTSQSPYTLKVSADNFNDYEDDEVVINSADVIVVTMIESE